MKRCVIDYGLSTYFLDQITSVKRIYCGQNYKKTNTSRIIGYWSKEFHFGGDILDIRREFEIPICVEVPKKHWYSFGFKSNPAWDFWVNKFPTFSSYREQFGEDKEWLDYCKYIAEKTNSIEQFNDVCKQAQVVIDHLKEMEKE